MLINQVLAGQAFNSALLNGKLRMFLKLAETTPGANTAQKQIGFSLQLATAGILINFIMGDKASVSANRSASVPIHYSQLYTTVPTTTNRPKFKH